MMLIFILSTLAVLAISIILSERQQVLRRNTKTFDIPPNVKSNYAKTYKKQPDSYFMNDSFLMSKYMNYFNNKLIEKSSYKKDKSKYSYKKQNNRSTINWPKN